MNRMNRFKIYLLYAGMLIGCTGLQSSCASDDERDITASGKPVEVTLAVSTRAGATDDITAPESEINTLRIYAFRGDELAGYYYGTATENITMKLPSGEISFYAIANEKAAGQLKQNNGTDVWTFPGPVDGSVPDFEKFTVTAAQLEEATFSTLPQAELASGDTNVKDETGKTYKGAVLPMTGKTSKTVSANSTVQITLMRSVAKLNLYFSKVGVDTDILYLGRGLYLYNVPQYGYLFPRDNYEGSFNYLETDDGVNTDSWLHQKGGMVILKCGWPEETADADPNNEGFLKTHINEITIFNNTPSMDASLSTHQYMPQRPIYLFANPNEIPATDNLPAEPSTSEVKGYYLKIMAHMHRTDEQGTAGHPGKVFYVSLPEVKANDNLEVYSTIFVDGYIGILPHWKITEWTAGGANIGFN